MLEVNTYFAKSKVMIEEAFGNYSETYYSEYPKACYTSIEDTASVQKILEEEYIDYINISVKITHNDHILLGFLVRDIDLWSDLLKACEIVLENKNHINEIPLGIEPVVLKLKTIGNQIELNVYHEYDPARLIYNGTVLKMDFLYALLNESLKYYEKLISLNGKFRSEGKFDSLKNKIELLIAKI